MMDMGGVPEASVDTRINVGKNNKVQAVALDFHLITRSIEERRMQALAEKGNSGAAGGGASNGSVRSTPAASASAGGPVRPDASLVEKMANLLNVNINGNGDPPKSKSDRRDDLSGILGGSNADDEGPAAAKRSAPPKSAPPHADIRSKYAAKLRGKIDGGVAGLELAKSEREDTLRRGDASVHLAARELFSSEGMKETNVSSSRWLATTGVGKLLSLIGARSMRIALLPLPSTPSRPQTDEDVERTSREMESLTKQLPNVRFDLLVPDGRRRGGEGADGSHDDAAEDVLRHVLSTIDVPPLKFVVVSDRDDYLRAARDAGMFTCRVRPKNQRRGAITTDYNVEDAGSVQDVINEINGISFNFALKG